MLEGTKFHALVASFMNVDCIVVVCPSSTKLPLAFALVLAEFTRLFSVVTFVG